MWLKWTRAAADSAVRLPRRDRNGGLLTFREFACLQHSDNAVKRPTGRAGHAVRVQGHDGQGPIGTEAIHGTDSSHPRALGIPIGQHCGLAKRAPRRSRWRPSHSIKSPHCLRGLAPQSLFVDAHAVKQGPVKMGKAQETLGDGARGAGTSTSSLDRSPADRLVRSSQGLCYAHWPACWAFLVDGVRGTGPAGARAELHPEVQTAPFRSHWHDEVTATGLPADE